MQKDEIESQKEVQDAAALLKELESQGLHQAGIASGWIRGWLMDLPRSDIDLAYVGETSFEEAQKILKESIAKLHLQHMDWDINGIWNATQAHPEVTTIERHYLLDYVCSIDCVYLASDGKLHDATAYGFEDAKSKTLRMNDFENMDFKYVGKGIVYLCLEGCRRIAKFGWTPTKESVELIKKGLKLWDVLTEQDKKDLYRKRIINKFPREDWPKLQPVYEEFGWGFVFNEASSIDSTDALYSSK